MFYDHDCRLVRFGVQTRAVAGIWKRMKSSKEFHRFAKYLVAYVRAFVPSIKVRSKVRSLFTLNNPITLSFQSR